MQRELWDLVAVGVRKSGGPFWVNRGGPREKSPEDRTTSLISRVKVHYSRAWRVWSFTWRHVQVLGGSFGVSGRAFRAIAEEHPRDAVRRNECDPACKPRDTGKSSDDDNIDDSEALLAELERIKKERAEEKLQKELQQQEEDLKAKEAKLMRGNPLININNSSSVLERRRDGDAVFKNQSRDESKIPSGMIFTACFCRNT